MNPRVCLFSISVSESGVCREERRLNNSRARLIAPLLIAPLVAILILTAPDRAAGDLIYKGNLGDVHTSDFQGKGTHFVWSATDPSGDSFTMNNVDGFYFQGHITVKVEKVTTLDYDFGRCTYLGGKNIIYADVELNKNSPIFNDITGVGWLNVDPKSLDGKNVALNRLSNETVPDWIKRITPIIMNQHITAHIYYTQIDGDLNPNGTQTVTTYVNGILKDPSFPASLASTYYLADGDSVDPYLQIDPLMRIPGMSDQEADGVLPEPSTLTLLGIGAVCSLGYGWLRRRQKK